MHARELTELAALVASHSGVIIDGARRLSNAGMEEYWAASKCRLERWTRAIKSIDRHPDDVSRRDHEDGQNAIPLLLGEVLTGEILTRVWTGIVCGFDRRNQTQEAEPVARSVLVGHLEARHRTLHVMVSGRVASSRHAAALNRVRRRSERWTDMLLGHVMHSHDVTEFGFDATRVREFADALRYERQQWWGADAWSLVLSSLRAAFQCGTRGDSPNGDLNERIASSVLACFGPDVFDSTGQFRSLWQIRLANTTADTQGMIEDLLGDERASSPSSRNRLRPTEEPEDGQRRF